MTRNAFFVAMTRARKSLHMITALKAGGAAGPHEFLQRLPDGNLEFSRYTKGKRNQEKFSGRRKLIEYLRDAADKVTVYGPGVPFALHLTVILRAALSLPAPALPTPPRP